MPKKKNKSDSGSHKVPEKAQAYHKQNCFRAVWGNKAFEHRIPVKGERV